MGLYMEGSIIMSCPTNGPETAESEATAWSSGRTKTLSLDRVIVSQPSFSTLIFVRPDSQGFFFSGGRRETSEVLALVQRLIRSIGQGDLEFLPPPVDRCLTRGCEPSRLGRRYKAAPHSDAAIDVQVVERSSRMTDASRLENRAHGTGSVWSTSYKHCFPSPIFRG